ncbi:MAG: thiamine phosphate synthase [Candidatus Eisenbacteria bacterium]|uniref:Thiamine-phosphate synthase n=1 Tax=Eiseniibacteriota bacterium TaxID=2212470 RepID=A0A948RVQ0_UNCEI|nr:thiamine phosphate synthase [Candidatus Eisenbacteria bacterium]MBU1949375.1 thiamine phosphate synthase [Candidatus Eisenbacteria bacterium]MBU2690448.1 thiamine phosphate synthase [Candidatus Eisenbacteria bacterium]
MRKKRWLVAITDTTIQQRFSHVELAQKMINGGADFVQYRDKEATTRQMIETAREIATLCARSNTKFIINDRVDVAIAADADGVHLGQDDFPIRLARHLLGPERVIGVSVDTVEEAREAWQEGADYVGFGPIYSTSTKTDAGPIIGIEALPGLTPKFPIPLVAIGGLNRENIEPVLRAGVHGVAVLAAICQAEDPEAMTREIREFVAGYGEEKSA